MQTMNNMVTKAETVGEELYLVHLRRHEGEEPKVEDFDFTTTRTPHTTRDRSLSAGEELWRIHLKRSRGEEGEDDKDDDRRKEETKPCRYNLRTRTRK